MADKDASHPPRTGGLPRPGMGPDLSPRSIEAAMREGNRLRAEAARDLFVAAGAGAADLCARAARLISSTLFRRERSTRGQDPSPNPSP